MIFTITRISTAMDGGGFIQARDLRLSQIHPNHQSIRQGFNRIEPRGLTAGRRPKKIPMVIDTAKAMSEPLIFGLKTILKLSD